MLLGRLSLFLAAFTASALSCCHVKRICRAAVLKGLPVPCTKLLDALADREARIERVTLRGQPGSKVLEPVIPERLSKLRGRTQIRCFDALDEIVADSRQLQIAWVRESLHVISAATSQQLVNWHAQGLPLDVPQSDIYSSYTN